MKEEEEEIFSRRHKLCCLLIAMKYEFVHAAVSVDPHFVFAPAQHFEMYVCKRMWINNKNARSRIHKHTGEMWCDFIGFHHIHGFKFGRAHTHIARYQFKLFYFFQIYKNEIQSKRRSNFCSFYFISFRFVVVALFYWLLFWGRRWIGGDGREEEEGVVRALAAQDKREAQDQPQSF